MADYIEREALMTAISEKFQKHYGNTAYQFIHDFFACVQKQIRKAPAADVAPVVHGRWVADEQKVWNLDIPVVIGWCCSVCGEEGYIDFDYCPNCGAKMDGDG